MERKQTFLILGVAALLAIIISAAIIISSSKKNSGGSGLPGLQTTNGPWQPEYSGLATRLANLQIPQPGKEKYHVHARVMIYADGKQLPIPTNIGLNPSGHIFSAIHTHSADGTIHIESDQAFDVKLADFFDVWGVKFTDSQLGGYQNTGDKMIQAYVNGNKVDNPAEYVLKLHDSVVVGYGAAGSFPTTWTTEFPKDL